MDNDSSKEQNSSAVRVRFPPSPTGLWHIGNARTALFNFLYARQKGGVFVFRIEDTDLGRSKTEYEKDIMENMRWLGFDWDEGPDIGGPYGPYRQSEKTAVYEKYLKKLLAENKAYYCFCSQEELEIQRQYHLSEGRPFVYSGKCRGLSLQEAEKNLKDGQTAVIRLRNQENKKIVINDLIRGKVEFDSSLLGDFAFARSLKSPLYNFSVVVDDEEMKITHVIRGEDHLSNTPKQILIQEALGFNKVAYGHLPMILAPDKTKLSKRHGSTGVSEYRSQGYLPEAIINFMVMLGWHAEDEREIFSLKQLIKEFSLERVQKQGAVFNIAKLDWINGFYLRQLSFESLAEKCLPFLIGADFLEIDKESQPRQLLELETEPLPLKIQQFKVKKTDEIVDFDYLSRACGLYQQRLKKLSEIVALIDYFFAGKLSYDKTLLKWKEMADLEIKDSLGKSEKILEKIELGDWTTEKIGELMLLEAEKTGPKPQQVGFGARDRGDRGCLLWPLRVALTGKQASAGPFEVAWALGKEKTLKRLKEAQQLL